MGLGSDVMIWGIAPAVLALHWGDLRAATSGLMTIVDSYKIIHAEGEQVQSLSLLLLPTQSRSV